MLSREELRRMKEKSFADLEPEEVMDIRDCEIDSTKKKEEKIVEILESGKNPYFIRCGGILVKIGFTDTGHTIEDALKSLINCK